MNKEEIKKDIDLLEQKIEQLKVEYEKFFVGIVKAEPIQLKNTVERIIRKYAGVTITNVMLTFRYKNLTARFLTYQEYWNRILRMIEEGNNPKDYRKIAERYGIKPIDSEQNQTVKTTQKENIENFEIDDKISKLYEEYLILLEKHKKKKPPIQVFKKTIMDVEEKVKSKFGDTAKISFSFEESENGVKLKTKVKKQ